MASIEKNLLMTSLLFCAISACAPNVNGDLPGVSPTRQPSPIVPFTSSEPEPTASTRPSPTITALPTASPLVTPSSSAEPISTPLPFEVPVHLYVENDKQEEIEEFTLTVEGEDIDFNEQYDFMASDNPKLVRLPCGANYLLSAQNSVYPPSVLRVKPYCKYFPPPSDRRIINPSNAGYFIQEASIESASKINSSFFHDSSLSLAPRIIDSSFKNLMTPLHTPMQFTFSVPMDIKSVEEGFAIRSADRYNVMNVARNEVVFKGDFNLFSDSQNEIIFNKRHLNFKWNNDATKLIISFKKGFEPLLPVPGPFRYTIGFSDSLRSATGITRAKYYFRFSQLSDPSSLGLFVQPLIYSEAQDYRISQIQKMDEGYQLSFDAIMFMPVGSVDDEVLLAGGMRDRRVQNRNAVSDPLSIPLAPAEYPSNLGSVTGFNVAGNYLMSGSSMPANTTWKSLGGEVVYNFEDETHTSVHLKWPTNSSEQTVDALILKYTDIVLPPDQLLRFSLVTRSGELSPELSVARLTRAAQLKALTSGLALSETPWTLREESGQWVLRLEDVLGEYVGLKIHEGNLTAETVTWQVGEPLVFFGSPGTSRQVRIKPKSTVLSVNGNHIAPNQEAVLLP